MSVTLEQLHEKQKELDARIIQEKGLEGVDLLPNTVLALQVEIGELANEWRGFKHWSNDREPRTSVKTCLACSGIDVPDVFGPCPICNSENPMLTEYVNCLHFFLSIARQLDLPADDLYAWEDVAEGNTTILFSELLHNVGLIHADNMLEIPIKDVQNYRREHFKAALFIFYALGEQRLGFDFDQIAAAYLEKNKTNHERQENGY